MHRDGFLNEKSSDGFLQGTIAVVKTPGGQQWYVESKHIWGADAVTEFEQQMSAIGDAILPWNELRSDYKRYLCGLKGQDQVLVPTES